MTNNRIIKLDIVRTIAILNVVLCHCVERMYDMYNYDYIRTFSLLSRVCMMTLFTISRLGVPLFLFLSGALLLKKTIEDDTSAIKFYKNNLLPLAIANALWNLIYTIYNHFMWGTSINVLEIIKEMLLLRATAIDQLWYIPMIMSLYIGVPIIAHIVKKFSFKIVSIIMVAIFVYRFIAPGLNNVFHVFGIEQSFSTGINIAFLGETYGLYMLIGFYIYNGQKEKRHNLIYTLITVVNCVLMVMLQLYSLRSGSNYIYYVWNDFPLLIITAASVFLLLNNINESKIPKFIAKISVFISKMSFGIYVVHMAILVWIEKIAIYINLSHLIKTLLCLGITFILSTLVVFIISRNKYLAKYLFVMKH